MIEPTTADQLAAHAYELQRLHRTTRALADRLAAGIRATLDAGATIDDIAKATGLSKRALVAALGAQYEPRQENQ